MKLTVERLSFQILGALNVSKIFAEICYYNRCWGRKPLSKNTRCPRSKKPRVLISILASFELFDFPPCSSSPDNGVNLGLIVVSLHMSGISDASRKSLCRINIKPHSLQLILCWIPNLLCKGTLLIDWRFPKVWLSPRHCAAWKVSVFGVFLVRIFPHLDCIRRDTKHLSVFGPNVGKYGPEKLQILMFFRHYDIFINNRNKHYASFRTLAYSQPGFVIPFSENQVLSNQWWIEWRKICDVENKHIYFAFWLRSVSTVLVNFS